MGMLETVILWGRNDGLGAGIRRLLPDTSARRLIWIENTDNTDVLFQAIQKEAPGVVIIYDDDHLDNAQLPILIINLMQTVRVVEVSLKSNLINVYSKYQANLESLTDLLAVVEE